MLREVLPYQIQPLNEEITPLDYQELTQEDKATFLKSYLPPNALLPETTPPYPSSIFPKFSTQVISMVFCLLGNDHD